MNSNPQLRLLTLLISTALLLAALAAGATAAPAAKKKPSAGEPAMAELWLRNATRPAPGGKPPLSPALRRAVPEAGRLLAREIAGLGGGARASAARGPVVERVNEVIGREELGGGVVAEGRIRGKVYGDDSHEVEVELELRDRKGNGLLITPDFTSMFAPDEAVGCPTAAGEVTVRLQGQMGGTAIRLKGKRVLASKTVSQSWRIRARGQVGSDARLQSVAADVTLTAKQFERGVQLQTTVDSSATLPRQGAAQAAGKPKATVSARVAGATRAEEREYEARMARDLVGTAEVSRSLAGVAELSRSRLLEAEPTWYEIPNQCAELTWDPGAGIALKPDETRRVTGTVIARRDGGRAASGRIEISGVSRGHLIPVTPSFSAAAPASFIAGGDEPDANGLAVQAVAVATSTAGRAQASWSARGTQVELPQSFSGMIASTSSAPGLTRAFSGTATYTRTSVVRGPDGSLTAWYELTAAALGEAKEILGPTAGCRYEATGTDGNVESGDLELRVLPGGEVVYALLYDLKVPSELVPTDCPPGQPSLGETEIAVFLNTRRPGPVESQLRPAGEGFRLGEHETGDVTAEAGTTTSASWSLMPN